jgi:predicted nucleotidyltransferase
MSAIMAKAVDDLKRQMSEALGPLEPEKVILFGSYAWGQPTEDSDIDLYVVTQDDFTPATWRQAFWQGRGREKQEATPRVRHSPGKRE